MSDSGSSEDETRLHVLVGGDDLPILDFLGDGADFHQQPGQDSAGAAGLGHPTAGWGCCVNGGCAFHGPGLAACAKGGLTFSGTWVPGKPRKNNNRILL